MTDAIQRLGPDASMLVLSYLPGGKNPTVSKGFETARKRGEEQRIKERIQSLYQMGETTLLGRCVRLLGGKHAGAELIKRTEHLAKHYLKTAQKMWRTARRADYDAWCATLPEGHPDKPVVSFKSHSDAELNSAYRAVCEGLDRALEQEGGIPQTDGIKEEDPILWAMQSGDKARLDSVLTAVERTCKSASGLRRKVAEATSYLYLFKKVEDPGTAEFFWYVLNERLKALAIVKGELAQG